MRFIIEGRLAGSNEIKYADRSHWSIGAKLRKEELARCKWAVMAAKHTQKACFTNAVGVSFAWIEPNGRRDLDNIISGQKAILDALVTCGVLANDGRKWVKRLIHEFPKPDKKNPRVIVTVEEIKEAEERDEKDRHLE